MGLEDYLEEIRERGFGETGDRAVCLDCILDEGLREQVAPHLTEHACTFCGREAADEAPIAADFETLMRPVMDAIRFLYCRSIDTLFIRDDMTPRYTSWEVAEEICTWAVSDSVLEAICEVITPDEWNKDPGMLPPNVALYYAWSNFCDKVKHETRFVFLSIPEQHSDHPDNFTTGEILDKLMEVIQIRGVLTELPVGHTLRVIQRCRMLCEIYFPRQRVAIKGWPVRERIRLPHLNPQNRPSRVSYHRVRPRRDY
jgi:HEPN/RES N-terminal domain 1